MALMINHCDDGTCEACGAKLLAYAKRLTTGGRAWLTRLGFSRPETDRFQDFLDAGKTAEEAADEVKGRGWKSDPAAKAARLRCVSR